MAPDGLLLAGPGGGYGRRVACFYAEVEFFPNRGGESAGDADRPDRSRPASAILQPDGQAQQDIQVLLDGGPDAGTLNLHRHRGAGPGAVAQPGR